MLLGKVEIKYRHVYLSLSFWQDMCKTAPSASVLSTLFVKIKFLKFSLYAFHALLRREHNGPVSMRLIIREDINLI